MSSLHLPANSWFMLRSLRDICSSSDISEAINGRHGSDMSGGAISSFKHVQTAYIARFLKSMLKRFKHFPRHVACLSCIAYGGGGGRGEHRQASVIVMGATSKEFF